MIQNKKCKYKREMDDIVKQKISAALRGRAKSTTHRQAISDGLRRTWSLVNKIDNEQN